EARWLEGAEVVIVDDLELEFCERELVAGLARLRPVRLVARERPPGLARSSFAGWAADHGIAEAPIEQTVLGPLAPPAAPASFAPVPFASLLDKDAGARALPSRWDAISRDAGIVSGLDRWRVGLRAHADAERAAADDEPPGDRAERRRRGAAEAEALLAVVEALAN